MALRVVVTTGVVVGVVDGFCVWLWLLVRPRVVGGVVVWVWVVVGVWVWVWVCVWVGFWVCVPGAAVWAVVLALLGLGFGGFVGAVMSMGMARTSIMVLAAERAVVLGRGAFWILNRCEGLMERGMASVSAMVMCAKWDVLRWRRFPSEAMKLCMRRTSK